MPDYTDDQKKEVERLLKIESTDYYTILRVDKKSNAVEIKKAYRRLAMKLHPDKNKHPQAGEAFKKIAKAFEVLGDEKKRNYYDQTGTDPDSRGMPSGGAAGGAPGRGPSGMGSGFSPFGNDGAQFFYTNPSPFGNRGGGGGMFDEDLFDMLFGGNNAFTFGVDGTGFRRANFGNGSSFFYQNGPGMRHRTANGRRARRNAGQTGGRAQRGEASGNNSHWLSVLYQYLPLLVILIPMLFNAFMESFGDGSGGLFDRTPSFSFETSPAFSVERTSPNLGIKYYLTKQSVDSMAQKRDAEHVLHRLGRKAEDYYVKDLKNRCQREQRTKERMIEDSYGIFFVDQEKLKKAQEYPTQSCDRLRELKLL